MEKMTLPLGLVIFDTQRVADMSATMAAASMMMMPMIIIFVVFQKQFVKGMNNEWYKVIRGGRLCLNKKKITYKMKLLSSLAKVFQDEEPDEVKKMRKF